MSAIRQASVGLAALLACAAPAASLAGELDVSVKAGPVAPTAVTFLDITAGPVPELTFLAADGTRYRLAVTVEPRGGGVIDLHTVIHSVQTKKNGSQKIKLVTDAVLQTSDGQEAELAMTLKGANAGDLSVKLTPRLDELLNRPKQLE